MGTKIHYASGAVVELQDGEGDRFWNRARTAGFRYYQSLDQKVIPFNHPTIEFIELDLGRQIPIRPKAIVPEPEPEKPMADPENFDMQEVINQTQLDQEVKRKEFMAKAACNHKNANGISLRTLFYTDTVNGRKYFPVCTFCGHREKYVGVPKIEKGENPLYTMENVRAAQLYEG